MWRSILIILLCVPCSASNIWIVATNGLAGNAGTLASPLSLTKAISVSSPAAPGDQVWLTDGTYVGSGTSFTSDLAGVATNRIIVTHYPGQRAVIDGNYDGTGGSGANAFVVRGAYTDFIDLEVLNSYANRGVPGSGQRSAGFDVGGNSGPANSCRIINCYIHDVGGSGVGLWINCTNCESYGNVIFNVGYTNIPPDRGHGHAIYTQNTAATGVTKHRENILGSSFDHNFQLFQTSGGGVDSEVIEGNVSYNAGGNAGLATRAANFLVYGLSQIVSNVTVDWNFAYHIPGSDSGAFADNYVFGLSDGTGPDNYSIVISNNYSANSLFGVHYFTNATIISNTMASANTVQRIGYTHPGPGTNVWIWDKNTYISPEVVNPFDFNGHFQTFPSWKAIANFDLNSTFTSNAPTANAIFVRTNSFQTNRANIIIYNWHNDNNVSVDLTGVVTPGTVYKLRNASDFGGNPVLFGTYDGGSISIPMTNLNVVPPIGAPTGRATAPAFATFVLVPFVGNTNFASDCSFPAIQNAVNLCNEGDTVLVPAGSCSPVYNVLVTKHINILAQGLVTLSDSITNAGDGSGSSIFNVSLASTPDIPGSIAGFSTITGSRATELFDSGNIHVAGRAKRFRVYANTLDAGLNIGIGWYDCFGVADHNIFPGDHFKQPMKIHHAAYGIDQFPNCDFGDGSWALPAWTNASGTVPYETPNALYIEDNFFTNKTGIPGLGIDADSGARYVARHNISDRMIFGGHGTETTGRARGIRVHDVYNNLFIMHGDSEAGHWRSGSGVTATNTIQNSTTAFTTRNYRMGFGGTFRYANGTNLWDVNDPVIYDNGTVTASASYQFSDNTKNWTINQWIGCSIRNIGSGRGSTVTGNTVTTITFAPSTDSPGSDTTFNPGDLYEVRRIITVLDEVGRGGGIQMSNSTPVINNTQQWPQEAVDPVYNVANTINGVPYLMNNGGYYSSVVGQEIINGSLPAGWKPFQYPHPLVSGTTLPPAPPSNTNRIARVNIGRINVLRNGP